MILAQATFSLSEVVQARAGCDPAVSFLILDFVMTLTVGIFAVLSDTDLRQGLVRSFKRRL